MERGIDPKNILLVEDNPADVFLVRRALKLPRIDCRISVAGDGEEAMRFIDRLDASSKPVLDLLLLDLHLPKCGGADVLNHLRASERCGRTPVVILTSSDSPKDHVNAGCYAPVDYFRKPSSLEEFMELGSIVEDVMGRTEASNQLRTRRANSI
jgi:DNA-binding response OmpR family regulator